MGIRRRRFYFKTEVPPTPPFLDSAKIVLSTKKLVSTYSGSCLRVRRSSDNSEQDIGFSGVDLDTASLLSFVGANDGYVTTLYDQSGNGWNLTQTTAANQPSIVLSGSVNTGATGGYYLNFDGSNDIMVTSGSAIVASQTEFTSIAIVDDRGLGIIKDVGVSTWGMRHLNTGGNDYLQITQGSSFGYASSELGNNSKLTAILYQRTSNIQTRRNGTELTTGTALNLNLRGTGGVLSFGVNASGGYVGMKFLGYAQFDTYENADISNIETEINDSMSIY